MRGRDPTETKMEVGRSASVVEFGRFTTGKSPRIKGNPSERRRYKRQDVRLVRYALETSLSQQTANVTRPTRLSAATYISLCLFCSFLHDLPSRRSTESSRRNEARNPTNRKRKSGKIFWGFSQNFATGTTRESRRRKRTHLRPETFSRSFELPTEILTLNEVCAFRC